MLYTIDRLEQCTPELDNPNIHGTQKTNGTVAPVNMLNPARMEDGADR
jgi:hypothetical protein